MTKSKRIVSLVAVAVLAIGTQAASAQPAAPAGGTTVTAAGHEKAGTSKPKMRAGGASSKPKMRGGTAKPKMRAGGASSKPKMRGGIAKPKMRAGGIRTAVKMRPAGGSAKPKMR